MRCYGLRSWTACVGELRGGGWTGVRPADDIVVELDVRRPALRRQSCAAAVGVVELDVRTGRGRALREGIRGGSPMKRGDDNMWLFLVVEIRRPRK